MIHFGIREHAMGAILSGIALAGLTRPYGATYLVFSDYLRPAVRLAALMRLPVLYLWSHDSVAVGEDGPTHQPVEQLWSFRAVPGLAVVRPADANETLAAWQRWVTGADGPTAFCLSRQALPVLPDTARVLAGTARGAYILADTDGTTPDVILIATGSEVHIALAAREQLRHDGIGARVVSAPCLEWFEAQPSDYLDEVLPPDVAARVSVEAGNGLGWYRWIGTWGRTVSVEGFGASGPGPEIMRRLGITTDAVVQAARTSIADVRAANRQGAEA
jgi:transketolase